MKSSKVFIVSLVVTIACILVGLTAVFNYSSTELAAKTCFQAAEQLQLDYQRANRTFAPDLSLLKDLDETCTTRFEMKVENVSENAFLLKGRRGNKQFTLDQNQEWKVF